MLMEHAADVRNLTASLAPSVAGHFDVNDDGIVSRKEYNRFLRKYGIEGMRQGLQSAVDASLAGECSSTSRLLYIHTTTTCKSRLNSCLF